MISYRTILVALACTGLTVAAPAVVKRDNSSEITDITILQYALTLEHLESNFYSGALSKFDASAFESAGFPNWVRERVEQISEHEAEHVYFLQSAIGENATQACTYDFPYTDPKSFLTLSSAIEGVGTAAYLGAAKYITDKAYLTAAGSILATEARHTAWISSAALPGTPWSGPVNTPLDLSGVYSIAAQFITSCPSSNPSLPVKTFPMLTLSPTSPTPGSTVQVMVANGTDTSSSYLAYYNGLSVSSSSISNGETTVPSDLVGTVYAQVVNQEPTADSPPTDDSMMSSLSILDFGLAASAKQ